MATLYKVYTMKKIYRPFITLVVCALLFSCSKENVQVHKDAPYEPAVPADSLVSYKMIITGHWKTPEHSVPPDGHFSNFDVLVHSSSCFLFRTGLPASYGVQNVAETGNTFNLVNEFNEYITDKKALRRYSLALQNVTATDSVMIFVTPKNALVSFETMLGPAPDWFAGLDSYSLLQNGNWVSDITVGAPGYDAGTKEGNIFSSNTPATYPHQNVTVLTPFNAGVIANGNITLAPFIYVRFIRQ